MARSQTITAAAAQRARIVLMAAEGVPNAEIARRVGRFRPTVVGRRGRYQERGIAGLADEDRPGRPPRIVVGGGALVVAAAGPRAGGVVRVGGPDLADAVLPNREPGELASEARPGGCRIP